jgi:hypothetical protein
VVCLRNFLAEKLPANIRILITYFHLFPGVIPKKINDYKEGKMIHLQGKTHRETINSNTAFQLTDISFLKQILTDIEKKLGICTPCIISNLFLTLIIWALLVFTGPRINNWYILTLLWFFACSFSILLLSHIVRFIYLSRTGSGTISHGSDTTEDTKEC